MLPPGLLDLVKGVKDAVSAFEQLQNTARLTVEHRERFVAAVASLPPSTVICYAVVLPTGETRIFEYAGVAKGWEWLSIAPGKPCPFK